MKKQFISLFTIIFFIYIGVQLYNLNTIKVTTERVMYYTAGKGFTMDGIVFRNEDVLYNMNGGVVSSMVAEGAHVGVGANVATVYQDEKDVQTKMKIRALDEMIAKLREVESPTGLTIRDPIAIDNKIASVINNVVYDIGRYDMSFMYNYTDEIELLLTAKSLATNKVQSYEPQIKELVAERNKLENSINRSVEDVYTPVSGYFCTTIDGMEEILTPKMLNSVNVADVDSIMAMEKEKPDPYSSLVVGKVIRDFYWYYVGSTETENLKGIKIGQNVNMKFPFNAVQQIPGEIYHISGDDNGRSAVVIRSNVFDEDIKVLRNERCDISFSSYSGIKVPKSARRVVDGKIGVFVLRGSVCEFKEVDVLYEGEDYLIVKKYDPYFVGKGCLQLTDLVITEGKNLHNGKIVR